MNTKKEYRPFTEQDARDGVIPVYRNGTIPAAWHLFEESITWKIVSITPDGYIMLHTSSGSICRSVGRETNYDLVIQKEVKEYWANLYKNDGGIMTTGTTVYTSKIEAENCARDDVYYLDTVKVREEYI